MWPQVVRSGSHTGNQQVWGYISGISSENAHGSSESIKCTHLGSMLCYFIPERIYHPQIKSTMRLASHIIMNRQSSHLSHNFFPQENTLSMPYIMSRRYLAILVLTSKRLLWGHVVERRKEHRNVKTGHECFLIMPSLS